MSSKRLKYYYVYKKEFIYLLGGKCVKCNTTEKLEFDHINPKNKNFSIGSKIRSFSKEKLLEELEKCQLLCRSCHKEKNKIDNGEAKCGSLAMYTHHRCRCDLCKKSWSDYMIPYKREWRKKKRDGSLTVEPLTCNQ